MSMQKKFSNKLILLVLSSLLLVLASCGGDSDSKPADNEDSGEKKTLIAGTDATYAPMESMDKDGEIVGIDIDIVNAIAEAAGFEVEYRNIGWEPLFPAVDNDEVDFAVSSITITDEREESFDFTESYYVANQIILVPEDSDIKKFTDLEGKKVSAQINTTGHIVLQDLLGKTSKDIVAAETMPFAIEEVLNGNAVASVGDNSTVNEYIKNNPDVKVKTIEDDSFEKENYGLMVKKDNTEVKDLLNEGIQKIKESGELEEITGITLE
ncbi:MAG TPA: basic amino acid ABC transporter substrate-binding protein [Pseudogracilibacillus sp.]|nr:basic amino acid ABC transporter substrate-binding protein [Pseudogracilibacillus sp.]